MALPTDPREIADRYTFTPADLDLIAQCRGDQNRMGFAIQLCFLRYPGRAWTPEEPVPIPMLSYTVHESRVTSVQKRMEPRRSLLGASVDQTEARNSQLEQSKGTPDGTRRDPQE